VAQSSGRLADQVKGYPWWSTPSACSWERLGRNAGPTPGDPDPSAPPRPWRKTGSRSGAGTRVRHFAHARNHWCTVSIPRDTSADRDSLSPSPAPRLVTDGPGRPFDPAIRLRPYPERGVFPFRSPPISCSFRAYASRRRRSAEVSVTQPGRKSLGLSGLKDNGAIGLSSKPNAHAGGELHA
jgi:hypothetical protein